MAPDSPRRPGRPSLKDGEKSTQVNVRVPNSEYDRACELAIRNRVPVARVFRHALQRFLKSNAGEDDEED